MKKVLSLLIAVFMIATILPLAFISVNAEAWDGIASTSFGGGDGTQDNPYIIATPAQLAYLSETVGAGTTYEGQYIIVTADIDLGGQEWIPIGFYDFVNAKSVDAPFMGTFDGQGHTIGNMKITTYVGETGKKRIGLFGLTKNATIKNFTIESFLINITKSSTCYFGNVVGEATNCIISNIIVESTSIINIYAIAGDSCSVGGIAGRVEDTNISYCINKSNTGEGIIDTSSTSANLGGIVGCTIGRSFISNAR